MKTRGFISVVMIAFLLLGTSSIFAQQHQGLGKAAGTKFTDDQKAKIKEIHMASYKEMKALRDEMGELKAKQHTLTTADKADMNAINANIDEISKVMTKMMKIKASEKQQIRSLLTDEQKMWFDSEKEGKGKWHQMRMGKNELPMHKDGHGFRGDNGNHEDEQHS